MKKNLIFCSLLCVAAVAHAQSSVTLYGLLDDGLTFNNNVGGSRTYRMAQDVIQSSRWGVRGSEDLGAGLKAIFTLEGGFNINSGAMANGSRLFGRQAFVGLSSNYGTVTLGRQYDVGVDFVEPLTLAGFIGAYAGHPQDNDNLQNSFRINNAVKYASPRFGGFGFEAVYGFSNTAGGTNQNSAWSVGANYAGGPVAAGIAVTRLDHPASNTNGAVGASGGGTTSDYVILANNFVPGAVNSDLITAMSGTYTFGSVTVGGEFSHVLYDMPSTNVWFNDFELNAKYFLTPSLEFGGAVTYTDGKVDSTGLTPKWYQGDLIVDYFLSKRTDVYVQGEYERVNDAAQFANIYTAGGASSTRSQVVARVGIRTKF